MNWSNILWNSSLTEGKIAATKWPEIASPVFLVFKIFSGEDPPHPPPLPLPLQARKCDLFFQSNTAQ